MRDSFKSTLSSTMSRLEAIIDSKFAAKLDFDAKPRQVQCLVAVVLSFNLLVIASLGQEKIRLLVAQHRQTILLVQNLIISAQIIERLLLLSRIFLLIKQTKLLLFSHLVAP